MLLLAASDKGRRNGQVTGRFGLGFKSVFLLTDRPEILSGRLAFDVVGGVFPRRLDQPRREGLVRRLAELSSSGRNGTLVCLPVATATLVDLATQRFLNLVHVL